MSRTYEQLEPVISALDERIKTGLSAFPTDTAEGSIASFPDGADDIPLKSLVVNIDPVQSGSGDPSPDNVRPISGWTGANVTRCGKNLLDPSLLKDQAAWNTIPVKVKPNTAYTMSANKGTQADTGLALLYFNNTNKNGGTDSTAVRSGHPVTITSTSEGYVYVSQRVVSGEDSFQNYQCQIEEGSTVTDYEPYNGQTIPISWASEAGTVYGGHLDVLSGVLTVYPYYASYNGETLTGRWISDRNVYAVGTTPTIGAQVVNIGAEGTEIQLSPHEVKSLLGQNNIFADTGDSAVEYRADTKMYIERLTEPDADMIADANITSGQYFMVGNILYKATANIASGSAVIEGTNATRKSLSEALNEINQ